MNRTHLEHALFGLMMQVAVGLLTGNWWAGSTLAIGIFVGREHAQAEYRWIETFGSHRRAYMPWWGGFDLRVWKADAWLDWIFPAIVTVTPALFFSFF